jgi:hypothetical protein
MTKIENLHHRYYHLQLEDLHAARMMNHDVLSDRYVIPKSGCNETFGGIILSRVIERHARHLPQSELKMWQPRVETIYGTFPAHPLTRNSCCNVWHEKAADWTWAHFPAPQFEDRRPRPDREDSHKTENLGLPLRNPFQLSRGIILILRLLESVRVAGTWSFVVTSTYGSGKTE